MKKLYFLFLLSLMTVLSQAQVVQQLPMLPKSEIGHAAEMVNPLSLNAKPWTRGELPNSIADSRRASSRRSLSSVQELVGGYKTTQVTYDDENDEDKESETVYTFVLKGDTENEIVFTGLVWGYDVKATVDLETGEFEIPHQHVFDHSTYGSVSLTLFFYYEGDDTYEEGWYYSTNEGIPGMVGEDGSLLIGAYYCLTIDELKSGKQTYNNYPISYLFKPGILTPTNGAMVNMLPSESTDENAEPEYQYIAVEIAESANTVSVTNFAGYGETVQINLSDDNTLSIAKQLVYQGGTTYGNFNSYSYKEASGATSYSQIISENPIVGKYDADALTWGPWIMYSKVNKKEYGILYLGGIVLYTDGTKFPDPSAGISNIKAEQSDAPIYSIDGRRLEKVPAHGLYIQNGKKYIAK